MACFGLASEPVIFLYAIIYVINLSVLPQLVLKKICLKQNSYNETLCNGLERTSDEIQKESAKWWFYIYCCSLVPSVLTLLIWGPITDLIGRKKAMLVIPIASALQSLVYLVTAYFISSHPVYMLIGAFLSCFYGEVQGVIALCYAFLADLTADKLQHRTMRMALLEAVGNFAMVPAGLLSSQLLQHLGFVAVFVLTISINIVIFLYILFCLPSQINQIDKNASSEPFLLRDESPELDDSREQDELLSDTSRPGSSDCLSLLNPIPHVKQVINVTWNAEYRKTVLPLICAFGFAICAASGESIVQVLYLKSPPFTFTPQTIGYYVALQGIIRGVGMTLITQLTIRCCNIGDFTLVIIALLSQCLCYILIGTSRLTTTVFLMNIFGLAIPVSLTVSRSIITKQVPRGNSGAVLAAIEATDAIANIFSNAATLWLYHFTLSIYSGIVYFGLSGLCVIALLLTVLSYCSQKKKSV